MKKPAEVREPRSGVERELLSIREIVRALKRCESDTEQIRCINAAFAILKDARGARTIVRLDSTRVIPWEALS